MICPYCHGIGEVLIDRDCNIVQYAHQAVMMIPCPAGCVGGTAYCCDQAGSEDRAAKTPASRADRGE
jgi:hypothetical protein